MFIFDELIVVEKVLLVNKWSYTMAHRPALDYNHPLATENFDSGYFRDENLIGRQTRVFPGLQQIGNESGFNASIYVNNAADTPLIEVNRRYIGENRPVLFFMRGMK